MLKNIVILNDFAYVFGGAGKVAFSSARLLNKQGYRVIVFAAVGPVDKDIVGEGIEIVCLEQKDILNNENRLEASIQGIWNVEAHKKFSELLNQLNPDETIIHFHSWSKALSPSLFDVVANRKFEIVITIHDYFLVCPNMGLYNYVTHKMCTNRPSSLKCYITNCDSRNYTHKLWRSVRGGVQISQLRKLKRRINFVSIGVTNSNLTRDFLKPYTKHWFFVQNPIEIKERNPVEIKNNKNYLFVGRLSKEKGIDMFCEALTRLRLPGIVLGDGPLYAEMKNRYPNIDFCGWVTGEEMDLKVRQCKALLFPSVWFEGSPLTIPEMFSYGLPCICGDKCAATEHIIDGKNGYVFKMGDLTSFMEIITKYENSNINEMQQYIMDHFKVSDFSGEEHLKQLLKTYHYIMENKKS